MNRNVTNLIAAAATAASTAFMASTVAMETAIAATFVYEGSIPVGPDEGALLTIESETASDWSELLAEAKSGIVGDWTVKYGEELLLLGVWSGADPRPAWRSERKAFQLGPTLGGVVVSAGENLLGGGFINRLNYDKVHSKGAAWTILTEPDVAILPDRRSVPEPSAAIALGVLGLGAVASRLRRRSK